MRKRITSRTSLFVTTRVILTVVFVACALILVLYAKGDRINWNNLQIEPTGVISLQGELSDIEVFLGATKVATKLPVSFTSLTPGRTYTVTIQKQGYNVWSRTVLVSAGLVAEFGPIRLWPLTVNELPTEAVDTTAICQNNQPSKVQDLIIRNGEIVSNGVLITRLSKPITGACWFRDKYHLAYLSGRELHIVDKDGSNDVTVFIAGINLETLAVLDKDSVITLRDEKGGWFRVELK